MTNVGDNTVSVIDGATCNALVSSGCVQATATVPVGAVPVGIFADHANHTVYVTNAGDNTVSMIDSATCTGSHLAGCPSQPPPTVAVGGGPGDVDVNQVTHSVYVTILTGLSVFAENTCNATDQSGCGDVGQAVAPGIGTAACTNIIRSCGGTRRRWTRTTTPSTKPMARRRSRCSTGGPARPAIWRAAPRRRAVPTMTGISSFPSWGDTRWDCPCGYSLTAASRGFALV